MIFEGILELYPKRETLKTGEEIEIRVMNQGDSAILRKFFSEIPEEDKSFLRLNIDNEEGINRWMKRINEGTSMTLLAILNGELVAQASIHQDDLYSSRHIGHIRLRVSVPYRNRGIASLLSAHIFQIALKTKLDKLSIEIPDKNEFACRIFVNNLGFKKEAVLKGFVIDHDGNKCDLAILTNDSKALFEELKRKLRFADILYGGEY